jgi:ADP-heptose:LPS heptosyltransferase
MPDAARVGSRARERGFDPLDGGRSGTLHSSREGSVAKALERAGKMALARFIALFLSRRRVTAQELGRLRVSRLLVIRQHHQTGDMLLAVPAFRGIRARFGDARITLLATSVNAACMQRNPYVDEVLILPRKRGLRSPWDLVRFIADLRRRRFDAALVLNTVSFSVSSMLLAVASGARVRIGSTSEPFGHDLTSRFYHLELPLPPREALATMHESVHNLYPLSAIGVRVTDLTSLFIPPVEEERECERFLADSFGPGGRFIVVHPGAGKPPNVWPGRKYAEAVKILGGILGAGVVATGGPADARTLAAFLEACVEPPFVLPCPSIGFLGALMKRSVLTLCNDTGILHIAGAVGANCVAVFGPTDPARWKPVNETVVAVRGQDGCVDSVSVAEVVAAARALLGA